MRRRGPDLARRWPVLVAVVVALVAAIIVPLAISGAASERTGRAAAGPGASPSRPNIVFVLTDDLSWNLVRYMPHVLALQQQGMTFTNYTVTDSLCCPSRASILTGDFPHDTHVLTNELPDGGFDRFRAAHDERSTFATSVSAAGYRTGFMGKYLNGYQPRLAFGKRHLYLRYAYVPPGWNTFNGVDKGGYEGYDYAMSEDHGLGLFGSSSASYMTSVLQRRGLDFATNAMRARRPFLLEVASFAPHPPSTPAPQDVGSFAGLHAPRTPAFGRLPTHPPKWLAGHAPLTAAETQQIDAQFEKRVESVQAVDRMLGALESAVTAAGQRDNTVFVFSSDNGYHMGEYSLSPGKQTAFDTDVRVPLIVAGPGIAAGSTNSDVVENIDLRPTFDELAGGTTPPQVDGRSIVPLLHGEHPVWRRVAGIEHHKPSEAGTDPDRQSASAGVPPSYNAIRTTRFVYVRYLDGDREYYDLAHDPNELHNLAYRLTAAQRARLDGMLSALVTCHGSASCWRAGRPGAPVQAPLIDAVPAPRRP